MWCQIFLLLIIRFNLFTTLCCCPVSAASFTFLSTDSFLQEGRRCRPGDNIARSSWLDLLPPEERLQREQFFIHIPLSFLACCLDPKLQDFPESLSGREFHILFCIPWCICTPLSFKAERAPHPSPGLQALWYCLSPHFIWSAQEIYRKYSVI